MQAVGRHGQRGSGLRRAVAGQRVFNSLHTPGVSPPAACTSPTLCLQICRQADGFQPHLVSPERGIKRLVQEAMLQVGRGNCFHGEQQMGNHAISNHAMRRIGLLESYSLFCSA